MDTTAFIGVLLSLALAANAFPSGPPASACETMSPDVTRHGAEEQNSTSPFAIMLSSTMYGCGDKINVTLGSQGGGATTNFKGFMCQARADANTAMTTGMIMKRSYNNPCSDNYKALIAHNEASPKAKVEFTWEQYMEPKDFYIVCTVVENRTTYWVKQMSSMITFTGNATQGCMNGMNGKNGADSNVASLIVVMTTMFVSMQRMI